MNKGLDYIPHENERKKVFSHVVERCQRHIHNATCYKYWTGPPAPKDCRFKLDDENVNSHTSVDRITGEITYQHLESMINNFNSNITEALQCNTDIIGSGASEKAILFYITDLVHRIRSGHVKTNSKSSKVWEKGQGNPMKGLHRLWAKVR